MNVFFDQRNVFFDQGMPAPLRKHLPGHIITTAYERGWNTLRDGELLKAVDEGGFQVLVTTDQNLHHQPNLRGRRFGVVVLSSTSWPKIQTRIAEIALAVVGVEVDEFLFVDI